MSRRSRVDPRRIKIHRSYTVEQLAEVLGCHKNTVRLWVKQGLPTLDDGRRPLLIHGRTAREFLEARKRRRKRPSKIDQLYCLRCREPRDAARNRAFCSIPLSGPGLLTAECAVCDTLMCKRVSTRSIPNLQQAFELQIHEACETPKLAA